MARTSYSAGPAARLLGISIPTLKRKCDAGEIPYFLTAGGHLRIPSDAVEKLLGNERGPAVRDPSSALEREERQEELGLAGQELRTRREAERSRAKPAKGKEMLPAQVHSPELQRNADLEGARLAGEGSRRQAAQKPGLEEARFQPEVLHGRWRSAAAGLLPTWLSFEQHETALEAPGLSTPAVRLSQGCIIT